MSALFVPFSRGGTVHLLVDTGRRNQSLPSLCGHVRLLHPDDNHTPATTPATCLRCLKLVGGFWGRGDAPYDWLAHGGV